MNCPKCGADNPDGSLFCGDCGAPIAEKVLEPEAAAVPAAAEQFVSCPDCGAQNEAGAIFCTTCRAVLTALPASVPPSLEPGSEHEELVLPGGHLHAQLPRRCPSCGGPVFPGEARCPRCGADPVAAALAEERMVPQDARGPILYEDRPIFGDQLPPVYRDRRRRRGQPFFQLEDLIDLIVRFLSR